MRVEHDVDLQIVIMNRLVRAFRTAHLLAIRDQSQGVMCVAFATPYRRGAYSIIVG